MQYTFDFNDGIVDRKEDAFALTLKFNSELTDKMAANIDLMQQAQSGLLDALQPFENETKEQANERNRENLALIRASCVATQDVLNSFRSLLNIQQFQFKDGKTTGLTDLEVLKLFYDFQVFILTEKKSIENEPSSEQFTAAGI